MTLLSFTEPANAIATDPSQKSSLTEKQKYAPGEVIVKIREDARPEILHAKANSERIADHKNTLSGIKSKYGLKDEKPVFKGLHNKLKAKDLSALKTADLLSTYVLMTDKDVLSVCEELKRDPNIEYAEPNYIARIQMVPNDPYYYSSGSWGQGYDDLWGIKKIKCEEVWDAAQGEGVVVAVIDTGVDYTHPDLAGNIWTNPGEIPDNSVDDDGNGYIDDVCGWDFAYDDSDPMDRYGHGSHCAGTIAAVGNNDIGVIGVAPKAKIMALKGLDNGGSGSYGHLAECIVYAADNGASILSNSWGAPGTSRLLTDAFRYANDKGCVCIAAAGNSDSDIKWHVPANIDTVIAVAASDENDERCVFSNWGDKVVAAPGGGLNDGTISIYNILSTISDYTVIGQQAKKELKISSGYMRFAGTSMACPHVAGIAALILGKNPLLSPEDVREIIQSSTDDTGAPGHDVYLGYGRVNALKACVDTKDIRSNIGITSPEDTGYVRSDVYITGSAYIEEGFKGYELYFAPMEDPANHTLINASALAVPDGLLGVWDTRVLPDGEYILTLKVTTTSDKNIIQSAAVNVDNISQAPVVDVANQGATIGRTCEFKISAHDQDDPSTPEGQLSFSAENLPYGARFDPDTKIFSWTPDEQDKGSYVIRFIVRDDAHTVTKDITLATVVVYKTPIPKDDYEYPLEVKIAGDKIVWRGYSGITMYNLTNGKMTQIAYMASFFDVNEEFITWTSDLYRFLYVYEISTGKTVKMTFPSSIWPVNPILYNNKILFRSGAFDLYVKDMATKKLTFVSNDYLLASHNSYAIFDSKIVWGAAPFEADLHERYDMYLYDSAANRKTRIGDDDIACINIYQDKIVWTRYRNGAMGYHFPPMDTYMNDLATGKKTHISTGSDISITSDIYEDKIVFAEDAPGKAPGIYVYDASEDMRFEIEPGLSGSAPNSHPAIYKNKIVWLQGTGWPKPRDICLAEFYYPPKITSPSSVCIPLGSALTINGTDFGDAKNDSVVMLDSGLICPVNSWSDKQIIVTIPKNVISDNLKVVTRGGQSNGIAVRVLTPPANLTATALSLSQVRLSWKNTSDNQTGFIVEGCEKSNFKSSQIMTVVIKNPNSTTVDCNSLAQGKTYYFRIKARNGFVNSPYSNIAVVTMPVSPYIKSLSPVSGKPGSSMKINGKGLEWTGNMRVIFSNAKTTANAVISSQAPTRMTIVVPNLIKGSYTIAVKDSLGESNTKRFTIK
ncbi:MAG: S8 family serine peptidase [Candidatus Omnitrophota bacterium]